MKKKTLVIFFLVCFILIGFILFFSSLNVVAPRSIVNLDFKNCNTQNKNCNIEINEFKINISIDENIRYLKAFDVSIWTEDKNKVKIDSIYIDFKMNNMNMGVNRFKLNKGFLKKNKQLWNGKALLPICVTGRADWIAEVEIITNKKKYVLDLPIQVKK